MKYKRWIIVILIAGILSICGYFLWRTEEIPPLEGGIDSVVFREIAHRYDIKLSDPCVIKESPFIIELTEVDIDNRMCKLDLNNSSTDQRMVFWASQNQPIKEIENIFGPHGFEVICILESSATIVVRHGDFQVLTKE
ncbi:MAG: hypothetical protein OEV87_10545 [Phycisphaerae bacterium]|nr:hypothetical protein [Phycisphaerae bacterium]